MRRISKNDQREQDYMISQKQLQANAIIEQEIREQKMRNKKEYQAELDRQLNLK